MADFKKPNVAPAGTKLNSREPHAQGGAPATGFDDAPQGEQECCNFTTAQGNPPSRNKIH